MPGNRRAYEQDYAGVGKLLNSPALAADLQRRAEAILAQAKATAPVVTGAYRDSLAVERDDTDRVRFNVVSTAAYANAVELRDRVLGRAIDAGSG